MAEATGGNNDAQTVDVGVEWKGRCELRITKGMSFDQSIFADRSL